MLRYFPLAPAKAGTQLLDSRVRGNERENYDPYFLRNFFSTI